MNNDFFQPWIMPRKFPQLFAHELHLWLVSLEKSTEELWDLWQLLTPTEKEKAHQFKFPALKNRFIVTQGTLRQLISAYLEIAPPQISFARQHHGKPYISQIATELKFNLSHAEHYALFAFALQREVGVDIELIRKNFPIDDVCRRFFHPDEVKVLLNFTAMQRARMFFNYWVRKEAFIKAIGLGLFCALNEFKIELTPQQSIVWGEGTRWLLQELPVFSGYAAAVVHEGSALALKLFR